MPHRVRSVAERVSIPAKITFWHMVVYAFCNSRWFSRSFFGNRTVNTVVDESFQNERGSAKRSGNVLTYRAAPYERSAGGHAFKSCRKSLAVVECHPTCVILLKHRFVSDKYWEAQDK